MQDRGFLAVALLERWLGAAPIRHARPKPIVFELEGSDAGRFSFDPRARGRRFTVGDVDDAGLRLYTTADVLLRMLVDESFELSSADRFHWTGDITLLSS